MEMIDLTPEMVELMLKAGEREEARSKTANSLISNYHFATFRDTEEIYHYRNGYYNNGGDRYIRAYIKELWRDGCTIHDTSEIVKAHVMPQTYVDRKDFNTQLDYTCVKKGILNIKTMELTPHTPEYKFTFQIPVEWNIEATCPTIDEWLPHVLAKEDIPIFWQMTGYTLWRSYPIHKAFMLTGDGANGKSTMINLLKAMIGAENIATKSLQDIVYNRFAASQLYGKHANLFADLSDKALNQTGTFKILTGGDTLDAEKKFKDAFNFTNFAKLIYSANKLPEVIDTTTAFFRRWIIINFPNTFDDTQADKKMIEKLTTPEELSGMLKNAVIALNHLLTDGKFCRSETTEQVEERYTKLSNSVAAFVNDCLEESIDAQPITRSEMYNIYAEYCRNEDLILKSQTLFTKSIKEFIQIQDCRKGQDRAWRGIYIKNEGYRPAEYAKLV